MNGIEVLAKIRNDRATKNTPVFAMSAAATKNDIARGLDAGFEQHLTKPLKIPLVFSAISEIFGTDKN